MNSEHDCAAGTRAGGAGCAAARIAGGVDGIQRRREHVEREHCDRAPDSLRKRRLDAAGQADSRIGRGGALCAFDREGHVRYKGGKTLPQLLDEFARARARGLDELRGLKLTEQDLARRGRHPALGTVTLSELLATWGAHDLTHLHQISRIMAHQAREAVDRGRVHGRDAVRRAQRGGVRRAGNKGLGTRERGTGNRRPLIGLRWLRILIA